MRTAVCMLVATAAFGAVAERPVRFAVIGDRTNTASPGVYESILDEIERLKPDFLLTVGDQIEGYTRDTLVLKRQWDEYKAIIANLSMPFYVTPGNHDITVDEAQPLYERYIGKPYYSFDYDKLHFIVLDVSRCEQAESLSAEQLAWLEKDLAKARKAQWTFVFYHKPFWYDQAFAGKPDTLHALFRRYGVDAVFSGHDHEYYSGVLDGIRYTAVGTSGGNMAPGPTGVEYQFIWVTVSSQTISIAPIRRGSVLPWDELTVGERKVIQRIRPTALAFDRPLPVDDRLAAAGTILLTVTNSGSSDLADTLRWSLPEGWSVRPSRQSLVVPTGGTVTVVCTLKSKLNLYPVPKASLRFPYAEGKTTEVSAALPVARTVSCVRAKSAPVIDGDLSDACWRNPVTRFFAPGGAEPKTDPARFYFAWDENNLYLAAYCADSDTSGILTAAKKQDEPVYNDDCAGYFFAPEGGSWPVFQIYFNPLGVVFDQKIAGEGGDQAWNGNYEAKTLRGADYWSLEARIPLEQLGATAAAGSRWRVNFRRKQPRLKAACDWQTPISYDPTSFGFLVMK